MLKVERSEKRLTPVSQVNLADAKVRERLDLQRMILASPEAFCREIGERLILIGEEVHPSHLVADRIDLLAVDDKGRAVIIELKRGNDRLQLLQALSYAAMISNWDSDYFLEMCSEMARRGGSEDPEDALVEHIGSDLSSLNHEQRVILIAEEFDWEVLATAEWLYEKHGIDIRCYRLAMSADSGQEYLTCTCIFPPPELREFAQTRIRRPRDDETSEWTNWDEALDQVQNEAMVEFFRAELARDVENRLRYRSLVYRNEGRRVLFVDGKRKHAYVWQDGRFEGDIETWRSVLESASTVKPVRDSRALRCILTTPRDFEAFARFVHERLGEIEFVSELPDKQA